MVPKKIDSCVQAVTTENLFLIMLQKKFIKKKTFKNIRNLDFFLNLVHKIKFKFNCVEAYSKRHYFLILENYSLPRSVTICLSTQPSEQ